MHAAYTKSVYNTPLPLCPDATLFFRFTLRMSGYPTSSSYGHAGIGVTVRVRTECVRSEWILANTCSCTVRVDASVSVRSTGLQSHCLVVMFAYAFIQSGSSETKDEFHRKLSRLLGSARSMDFVIIAGDFNVQFCYLAKTERHIESRFSALVNRTDNGVRLIQVCSDTRLFLMRTN